MTNLESTSDMLAKVTQAARIMASIKEIYAEKDYYKMELNRERLRRESEAKAKTQKEQETMNQVTQKYEDTIQKIRKQQEIQNQSYLKTISQKDRKIQSLSTLNSQLQHNFSMHETEINSIRANLVNKEEKKALSKLDEDLKKIDSETQSMNKRIQEQLMRQSNQIDYLESENIRYKRERDDYKTLYERAESRIKDQSSQITEMSFEIQKLKLDRQQVEICMALEERPQEKSDESFNKELEESTNILKQIMENIRQRRDHCVEVQRLHKHISSLTDQNSELRKGYLQKCSELDSLRIQLNPKACQEDLAIRNPCILEYFNSKRHQIQVFQRDLRSVYDKVGEIKGLMEKYEHKDITKLYSLNQQVENLKKMAKQIISFYRNFLQSMYFELRKQRRGGKKQQQVKAEHICCRCSTPLNRLTAGSTAIRCIECKNQIHEACIAQDYQTYFLCMGIKDILKEENP